jgi:hypothetical protein
MRILGNTIELIAANKAGIFKPHVPALIGPSCPYEVMRVSIYPLRFIILFDFPPFLSSGSCNTSSHSSLSAK